MRIVLFAGVLAATVGGNVSSASAAWSEYMFADLGIAKEFPAEPKREQTEYKTPVAGAAKATLLSTIQDNIEYRLTVVELQHKVEAGASIMGECAFMAEAEGDLLANATTRIEPGAGAIYGRLISVDLKNGAGRRQTACFFTKGRLYKMQATVLPANGQPNSSQAIRFSNSMRFDFSVDWSKVERNLNEVP